MRVDPAEAALTPPTKLATRTRRANVILGVGHHSNSPQSKHSAVLPSSVSLVEPQYGQRASCSALAGRLSGIWPSPLNSERKDAGALNASRKDRTPVSTQVHVHTATDVLVPSDLRARRLVQEVGR